MKSYNRYSYCFNNPLRFTDPSGYVVTIPPEYLLMNLYSTDINKYRKKIKRLGVDPNTISVDYNTDLSQDGLLFKTISWKEIGVDDPEDIHYLDVFEKLNNIDALPENIYRFISTNTAISLEMKHSIYSNHVVNIHKSFRYHKGNQRKYEYDYYMWGRNETHDQIKNNLMKYIVLFPKK